MERQFSNAWVQVVPSRWAEPFGIVATEAMMRGTALIASNSGGLVEVCRDQKTGLLIPPDDVEALTHALLGILQQRDRAEQFGQAGREVALANFSEEKFVDRFVDLYRAISNCAASSYETNVHPIPNARTRGII
jgi:glycosyltransferase involved in cell wall biosynthesis